MDRSKTAKSMDNCKNIMTKRGYCVIDVGHHSKMWVANFHKTVFSTYFQVSQEKKIKCETVLSSGMFCFSSEI